MKSLLIALLLIFAGCNEKSSSPERVAPLICGESKSLKCLPPIADWNIEVHLASFPDNVLLKIEGIEILNEEIKSSAVLLPSFFLSWRGHFGGIS